MKEMCDGRPPKGTFDLFAVEGGTAAMCYIFDSLMQNGLLKKGDTIRCSCPPSRPTSRSVTSSASASRSSLSTPTTRAATAAILAL